MLEFEYETAGVWPAAPDEIPAAEQPERAAVRAVRAGAGVRDIAENIVVEAEIETRARLETGLPSVEAPLDVQVEGSVLFGRVAFQQACCRIGAR